jgi:hypothetical protein
MLWFDVAQRKHTERPGRRQSGLAAWNDGTRRLGPAPDKLVIGI